MPAIQYAKSVYALALLGLLLFLLGKVITANPISKTHAASCTGQPAVSSNQGLATNWRVQDWLRFNNVPIAPSRWTVATRIKSSTTEQCSVEDWRIQRVVLQSSRDAERGKLIRNTEGSSNNLDFNYGASTSQRTTQQRKSSPFYCQYSWVNLSSCFTTQTVTIDPAFNTLDNDWSPLGQYGLLYTDNNNLENSRGYIPTEWLIVGN